MAKTEFQTGTKVLAEFLNKIFGGGAETGIVHDGLDEDGHASKIDITNHVEYGDHGHLEVTEDVDQSPGAGSSGHTITHSYTGANAGAARFATDIFRSASGLFEFSSEALFELTSETLSTARVELKKVLGEATFFADILEATDVTASGTVTANDLDALNAPIAWGTIAADGTIEDSYGVTSADYTGDWCLVTLSETWNSVTVTVLDSSVAAGSTTDHMVANASSTGSTSATEVNVAIRDLTGAISKTRFCFVAY